MASCSWCQGGEREGVTGKGDRKRKMVPGRGEDSVEKTHTRQVEELQC